jgi:hypothetical protein
LLTLTSRSEKNALVVWIDLLKPSKSTARSRKDNKPAERDENLFELFEPLELLNIASSFNYPQLS